MKTKTVFVWALVGVALILLIQNARTDWLNIFFWRIFAPKFILIVFLFAVGFFAGYLAGWKGRARGKSEAKPDVPAPPRP